MAKLTLTQDDNGQSFSVAIGQPITICLPESPTTGYKWKFDGLDESLITLESSDFAQATPEGFVGGGGERHFTLKGQNVGTVQIDLKLKQAGAGGSSSKGYQVTLQIHS